MRRGAAPATVIASNAVLPFADMSQARDQEYFSDGLSEELLDVLAKISQLRVIGRTSSFQFKGKNEDLRVIAQKLDVDHLREGSVRKEGNRIRITAQLIRASDASHLWSETYDRNLDDVFKIQDEIAQAVAQAMKVTLLADGLPARSAPVNSEAQSLCRRRVLPQTSDEGRLR
jgi:TolB-like protein